MNIALVYFISYLLSYLGYFLGNSTKEEHEEIKKYAILFSNILLFIFFGFSIYFLLGSWYILIPFSLLLLKLLSIVKKKYLQEVSDVLTFSLGFFIVFWFFSEYSYLFLLVMFYLLIKRSFESFHFKRDLYEFITMIILFTIFLVLEI